MPLESRSLYAYTIHGHVNGDTMDYEEFLAWLEGVDPIRREASVGPQVVAVPQVIKEEGVWHLRFIAGAEGQRPLLYDRATAEEREGDTGETELYAQAAWLSIDPTTRLVAHERRRPGVGVATIAKALAIMGRHFGYAASVDVGFHQVTSRRFREEVEGLVRIRAVEVVLARPNQSWRDTARRLTDYAAESNAGTFELGATASRGESLAGDQGLLPDVLEMVEEEFTPLKQARVIGRRQDDRQDRRISLKKYQVRDQVQIDTVRPAGEAARTIRAAAANFLRQLRRPAEDQSDV